MRHLVRGRKLGRTKSHRKATMQALCVALVREKRIQTTVAKAKELRRFIEPLVTRAKVDSQHNRRLVFGELQDKFATQELFDTIGPKVGDRPGGYTRVLKTGFRGGDAAEMALIELIDFNESEDSSTAKPKRSRRSRRSGGAGTAKATEAPVTAKDEAPVAEEAAVAQEEIAVAEEVEVVEEVVAADVAEVVADETPDTDQGSEAVAGQDAQKDAESGVDVKVEAPAAQEEVADEPKASEEPTAEASSDEPTDSDEEKKDA